MKLTIIGQYGVFPPANGRSNCYLIQTQNTSVVLDFGSGAMSGLASHIDLQKIDAIILSHLHYDHMADMLPFCYFAQNEPKIYNVFCPNTKSSQLDILSNCVALNIDHITDKRKIVVGDLQIEFYSMIHGMESYAMKITDGKTIFVYSGDTAYHDGLIPLCKGANVAVLDCGDADGSMPHHLSIQQAEKIANEAECSVIASHLFPYKEYNSDNINVLIAEKNLIIEIE